MSPHLGTTQREGESGDGIGKETLWIIKEGVRSQNTLSLSSPTSFFSLSPHFHSNKINKFRQGETINEPRRPLLDLLCYFVILCTLHRVIALKKPAQIPLRYSAFDIDKITKYVCIGEKSQRV
jgi:hypothetical protein